MCEHDNPLNLLQKTGAGERSRTLDLLITSQLLYQLSYTGEARIMAKKPPVVQLLTLFFLRSLFRLGLLC